MTGNWGEMADLQGIDEALALAMQDVDFAEMEQDIERFAQEPSVRQVLEVGIDLQNYSTTIAKELAVAEAEAVGDYLKHVESSAELQRDIDACDRALAKMEEKLGQFQGSLGQLSSDICTLQTRSQSIAIKLTNRKALEEHLGAFTRDISVSKAFVNMIVNGEIGPNYVKYLQMLSRKIEILNDPKMRNSAAAREVKVPIDRLRMKASDNIRVWLISNIDLLKEHCGTEQMAVWDILLKSKYLMTFLRNNSPEIEQSIKLYYTAIMSRIYLANFKLLGRRVLQQMMPISVADETLNPICVQKGFFSSSKAIGPATPFFAIRDRMKLVAESLSPPQSFGDEQYPVESLLRSLGQILIDAFTAEHNFCSEFFGLDMAISVFTQTIGFMESFMSNLLTKITDPTCVVVLLRFNTAQKEEMERRRIGNLDSYFTKLNEQMVDRFKLLCKNNVKAVNACEINLFVAADKAGCASALAVRYEQLAASMAKLRIPALGDLIDQEMMAIQEAVHSVLQKISQGFTGPAGPFVFLVKDYYSIVAALSDEKVPETAALAFWQHALEEATNKYVDLELESVFADLVRVVSKAPSANPAEAELKDISLDFKEKHVAKLHQIMNDLKVNFGPFVGKQIFELIAKRLFIVWTQFEKLCESVVKGGKSQPWFSNLLSIKQQLVSNIRLLPETFQSTR